MTAAEPAPGPAPGVTAQAFGQAQQAVLGQGIQNNYWYAAPAPAAAGEAAVVDTLVPPPRAMVGRAEELGRLQAASGAAAEGRDAVVVCVVHGMGGIGKTALARALAAGVRTDYPDARIEVDLYGFSPGLHPRPPLEVLGDLLRLADVPPSDVPAHLEGRSQLWRAWVGARRVLLLLDNARDAAQVAPLLPGSSTPGRSLVLLTSRHALTEVDAALRVAVGQLPLRDAVDLLARVGGRPGDGPDAPELATLARSCGLLPLALRSVGSMLGDLDPADLADVVRSAAHPFQHLARTDQLTAAAFTVSYQALDDDLRAVLRAAAGHPGPDFDADSVAALAGRPRPAVAVHLVELLQNNVLTGLPARRYTFHDLYLLYARRQCAVEDPDGTAAARGRLYGRLYDRLRGAVRLVYPDNRRVDRGTAPAEFPHRDAALGWLTAAADELVTTAHAALADEWPQARRYAQDLAYWLRAGARIDQSRDLWAALHEVARRADDAALQATALLDLGQIAHDRGDLTRAQQDYREARHLAEVAGDARGQVEALMGLGRVARLQGDAERAAGEFRAAHDLAERIEDARLRVEALQGVGDVADLLGDLARADDVYRRAHELAVRAGYRSGQADALCGIATVAAGRGDARAGAEAYRQAHDVYAEIGNLHGLAYALKGLGEAACVLGDHDGARDAFTAADALYRTLGFRDCQAQVRCGLGDVERAGGDLPRARDHYRRAEEISVEIGFPRGEAQALTGLAEVCLAEGDPAQARELLTRARTLYERLGNAPAAAATARRLDG